MPQDNQHVGGAVGRSPVCSVTEFSGYAAEVLRIRNTNRAKPESMEYLLWRYAYTSDLPAPRVFWLTVGEQRIGMASAIFRSYRSNGQPLRVAVIGDISLDAAWRNRGLGKCLLQFMSEKLAQEFPDAVGFVIPTAKAQKSLERCGWLLAGTLTPFVCVLDPTRYVLKAISSSSIARLVATLSRACLNLLCSVSGTSGVLEIYDRLPEGLSELLEKYRLAACVRTEIDEAYLRWRYVEHPHFRFRFALLRRNDSPKALIVFEETAEPGVCSVYDVITTTSSDARGLFAQFVRRGLNAEGLESIRVLLSPRSPMRRALRLNGFISRAGVATYQLSGRRAQSLASAWQVSFGDKDV